MKIRTALPAALAGAALITLAAPLAAQAHVTVTPTSTGAGAYSVLTFATSHGCDGSPTRSLTVSIPDGVASVAPTVDPGWTIEKIPVEGSTDAEAAVGQVVFTAVTPLADGFRDTVEMQVRLPEDAEGTSVAFPVLQTCEDGSTDWSEIPAEGETEDDLEAPAPTVVLTAADGSGHHGGASDSESHGDSHEGSEATATVDGETVAAGTSTGSDDVLARVLGIAGLAVGAAGIVTALTALRRRESR